MACCASKCRSPESPRQYIPPTAVATVQPPPARTAGLSRNTIENPKHHMCADGAVIPKSLWSYYIFFPVCVPNPVTSMQCTHAAFALTFQDEDAFGVVWVQPVRMARTVKFLLFKVHVVECVARILRTDCLTWGVHVPLWHLGKFRCQFSDTSVTCSKQSKTRRGYKKYLRMVSNKLRARHAKKKKLFVIQRV